MRRTTTFTALLVVAVVAVAAGVAEDATDDAADVTPTLHAAATPPPPLTLPDAAYWTSDIDGDDDDDAADDDAADVGSEDEVVLETAVDAAAAEATTTTATSTFTPITTFGTVPDADGIPSSTYRGVDLAVDGDAVFVALQDGGRNWRASVFRVDGGGAPKPVGGSPGFTPGPAMDLTLAFAPFGTPSSPRLAVAYREGVYHHGYYRDGDDSWVYVAGSPAASFAQVGAAFTNARPRDLAVAFAPTGSPIVAYSDDEYERRPTVRALDKTGGWPTLGEQGLSRGRVSRLQLAADAAGGVYAAYADASCDDRATVMKFTPGTNWTSVGHPAYPSAKRPACHSPWSPAPTPPPPASPTVMVVQVASAWSAALQTAAGASSVHNPSLPRAPLPLPSLSTPHAAPCSCLIATAVMGVVSPSLQRTQMGGQCWGGAVASARTRCGGRASASLPEAPCGWRARSVRALRRLMGWLCTSCDVRECVF